MSFLPSRDQMRLMRPAVVEEYLSAQGWEKFDEIGKRASLWRLKRDTNEDSYEVMVPIEPALRDFNARMWDVFTTLAAAEGRAPEHVVGTILNPVDAVQARIEREDNEDGTISLVEGARAFSGLKDVFAAAAASLENPRAFYPNKPKGDAARFLQRARLGQTQHGSYVISILAPHGTPLFPSNDETLERRVLRRLVQALHAARDAAEADTEEAFASRIDAGVSANLCDALARIGHGNSFRAFTFSVAWSWRAPPKDEPRPQIRFVPTYISRLREGATRLKKARVIKDFFLFGEVYSLEHVGPGVGNIVVDAQVDGVTQKVSLRLVGEEHKLAVKAYDERIPVGCIGELTKLGRMFHLQGPRKFGLLQTTRPVS